MAAAINKYAQEKYFDHLIPDHHGKWFYTIFLLFGSQGHYIVKLDYSLKSLVTAVNCSFVITCKRPVGRRYRSKKSFVPE